MISEFEKEKVFWTRKMNTKLVHFMKSKPHIWNPRDSKYTSVELRDQTYAQFAAKYDDQFSGQAVKERWTNIRSTFASYLRKLKAAVASGQEYKVNWHLWEPCQFLLKVNKTIIPNQTKEDSKLDVIDDSSSFSEEERSDDDNNVTVTIENDNNDPIKDVTCKRLAQDLVSVFHSVQNDSFGVDNTKNGKIGRTVTKKLSQMNSHDAAKVSYQIMGILLKYEIKDDGS